MLSEILDERGRRLWAAVNWDAGVWLQSPEREGYRAPRFTKDWKNWHSAWERGFSGRSEPGRRVQGRRMR